IAVLEIVAGQLPLRWRSHRVLPSPHRRTAKVTPMTGSSPAPPASALIGLLQFSHVTLEPRHQILGGLQAAAFIEGFGLGLGRALLRGLALTADMIDLLLQAATIDKLALKGCLDRGGPALRLCGFGLGSSELVAQRVVGRARRLQLRRQ